ncbi:MAG: hypothetical protein E2O39_09240 [Planctomycetota bacterium]|nr:MAG: hypothetical protein E2O39_09240 [Planctomycetota bacterium]
MIHASALALGLALASGAQAPDWQAAWAKLEHLATLRATSPEWLRLYAELEQLAETQNGVPRHGYRGRLLDAHLARVAGDAPRPYAAVEIPARWEPGEAWLAARVLEPGVVRASAYGFALAEARSDPTELQRRLTAAYEAFGADVLELRLESAEQLAVAMHDAADATWSALTLALLSTRLGRFDRADELLGREYGRARTSAERLDVLGRWAIAALGAGRTERARDRLGIALALGSGDAHQILGLLALSRGAGDRARRLFGALLVRAAGTGREPLEATPWALRGWGLALLPSSGGERVSSRDPLPR